MSGSQRDSLVFYDDSWRSRRHRSVASGWPVIAVMALGALQVLANLFGLLADGHVSMFGSPGGNWLAGAQICGIVLGIGLVMRKELARRVSLVFVMIGLVLAVIISSSYSGSFAAYVVGVGLDVLTVGLLIHPSVRRAFD
jgi:hypothetical protein